MKLHSQLALAITFAAVTLGVHAQSLAPLRARCAIGRGDDAGKFSLHINDTDCPTSHHCGSNFSNEAMSRFTGITPADLDRELFRSRSGRFAEFSKFCRSPLRQRG